MSAIPKKGETYFVFNSPAGSDAWACVTGSHWGVRVDPPTPVAHGGAAFRTVEAAERHRAAAAPGTAAARPDPLVRAQWLGGPYFRIVSTAPDASA